VRKPDFIVIGAMKSATTTLHMQLAAQHGIFMSDPKEPNFFSDDEQYQRGTDWYCSLFADAEHGDLCGESSTHYTKRPDFPDTVRRMKALVPDAKLVYVLRHPIDRLVSHYAHQWSQNVIRCSIDDAIHEFPELIAYSRYAYQLEPYLESYGRASVLPVFYPALKTAPQRELEAVASFIGLQGNVDWKLDLGSQNVSVRRLRRFRGYSLLVDSTPMETLRRRFVPQVWRDRVKKRLQLHEPPKLSHASEQRVRAIFDADLEQLSTWLGTPIDCDTFDEVGALGGLRW
jgi:hypothetical protein